MRIRAGAWGLVLLVLAMAWPGATQAAPPVKGAHYVANAPGVEGPLYLRVAANGRSLKSYLLAARVPCSDGKSRVFGISELGEKRFGITADGRFDFTSAGRFRDGRIRGTRSVRIVGSFAADQATLTIDHALTGSLRCKSVTPLTFTRVGAPGTSTSDSLMTTGRYVFSRSGSGSRIRLTTVRAVAPARVVEGLTVYWSVRRCARGGRRYRDNLPFHDLALTPGARFKTSESVSYPIGRGLRARLRFTLALRFQRRGAYRLTGTWKSTSRIYRRGKQIDTCRASQRFRSVARG